MQSLTQQERKRVGAYAAEKAMRKLIPDSRKVESVTDFIDRVLEIREEWLGKDPEVEPWFRGHERNIGLLCLSSIGPHHTI
jgi:hypothetical protein